jgi:hypothetical protein
MCSKQVSVRVMNFAVVAANCCQVDCKTLVVLDGGFSLLLLAVMPMSPHTYMHHQYWAALASCQAVTIGVLACILVAPVEAPACMLPAPATPTVLL